MFALLRSDRPEITRFLRFQSKSNMVEAHKALLVPHLLREGSLSR